MPTPALAMVLESPNGPLVARPFEVPDPTGHEVLIRVLACGVCRTDLHLVDGELPNPKLPIVPGHEIVGVAEALGAESRRFVLGARVGVPWLAKTRGACEYCLSGRENLCNAALFTVTRSMVGMPRIRSPTNATACPSRLVTPMSMQALCSAPVSSVTAR